MISRIEGAVPPSERGFARRKAVHRVEPIMVVGLVAAGEILEHRQPTDSGKVEVDKSSLQKFSS